MAEGSKATDGRDADAGGDGGGSRPATLPAIVTTSISSPSRPIAIDSDNSPNKDDLSPNPGLLHTSQSFPIGTLPALLIFLPTPRILSLYLVF